MKEENNNKKYKYISMIGVIGLIFSLIAISMTSATSFISGDIWKVINGDTIVQNDTRLNVNLGENESTAYKLNVHGSSFFTEQMKINNSLSVSDGIRLGLLSGSPELLFTWLINKGVITGAYDLEITSGSYLNVTSPIVQFDSSVYFLLDTHYYQEADFIGKAYFWDETNFYGADTNFYGADTNFYGNVSFDSDVTFTGKIYQNSQQVALVPKNSLQSYTGSINDFNSYGYMKNNTIWHLCNGLNGTTNLSGMFLVMYNATHVYKSKGGNATKTLTSTQLPAHTHSLNLGSGVLKTITLTKSGYVTNVGTTQPYTSHSVTTLTSTDSAGTGSRFNIEPKWYAVAYMQFMGY